MSDQGLEPIAQGNDSARVRPRHRRAGALDSLVGGRIDLARCGPAAFAGCLSVRSDSPVRQLADLPKATRS